jgi:Beta/Gamma crystallin/CVNH domain
VRAFFPCRRVNLAARISGKNGGLRAAAKASPQFSRKGATAPSECAFSASIPSHPFGCNGEVRAMKVVTMIVMGLVWAGAVGAAAAAPAGSYRKSCSGIDADGSILSAYCRDRNGDSDYTFLRNYQECDGDIANVNGRLKCVEVVPDENERLPRGSYRDTCRDEKVEDGTLEAECRDRNGRWRYTELQGFRSCRGDIANDHGMLRCVREEDDDADYDLPGGDWRGTCREILVSRWILSARCMDQRGQWRRTSIDLRDCDGNVTNWQGRLVCSRENKKGRITIYKLDKFEGVSRTYSTDVPDLDDDGFADKASSVKVDGGVWELCDRTYYRGKCVRVGRSIADLDVLDFDNRAASIRRIR